MSSRAGKREAITHAARAAFGRDGYTRSSIDTIAAEAAVSTRTIYNHFATKEQLFASVLLASATQVAEGVIEEAARGFVEPLDVRRALLALGTAIAGQRARNPEHFAMVRRIDVDAVQFPDEVRDAWQEAGPERVRGEVARRIGQLADRGLLRSDDPVRSALHLIALCTAEEVLGRHDTPPLDADRTARMVDAGVQAFLYGYGAAPPPDRR